MAVISEVNLSKLKSGFRIDSEFYKPDYVLLENELKSFNCKKIKHFAKVTDGEHGSVIPREFGVKYLTAENVKNGYIDISKVRYVDEKVDKRNKRASVRVGDVLISIKGTLGEVAVAETWLLPANMNRDVAIIKPYENADIQSEYLTIFLMSKFGAFQAKREGSGGVQQMITLERLREFLIPKISIKDQIIVKELYSESLNQKSLAESSYTQATNLLEEELGLDKIHFQSQKTYSANFSEIVKRIRFDGEYYAPKFKLLKNLIKQYKNGWEFFLVNVQAIKPNINPSEAPNKKFNYIELSDINPTLGTIIGGNKVTGATAPSRAKRLVNKGDLIASSVVGSVDKAGIITEGEDGYLASSGFFHFRSINYTPEFLLILVRNSFFIEQLYQESTGGILSAVSDSSLKNLIIPKIKPEIQEKITELVKNSHAAYRKSKSLLDQSKTAVETLIENAAINAS